MFRDQIHLTLTRTNESEEFTTGLLEVRRPNQEPFRAVSLERPWKDNERNISCIPPGLYKVIKTTHKSLPAFRVLDVPGRSGILIHIGNFIHQSEGCILPGKMVTHINNDKIPDVTHSKETILNLTEALPGTFNLLVQYQF